MFQKTEWLWAKITEDNCLGRNTRDEFTMEEERAKFTIWESIADNLWDKYNYKILRRETQRTGKTLSKTGGNHGSRTASFDVGKHVMLASKKEFQLLSTHKSKSKDTFEMKSDKW